MKPTATLKAASATVATIIGILGIVGETHTRSGALTAWAKWGLAALFVAGSLNVSVEVLEAVADARRDQEARAAAARQLETIQSTLFEVLRVTNSIPANLTVDIGLSIPLSSIEDSAATELREVGSAASQWPGTTHHTILLEELSADTRSLLELLAGQISMDLWHQSTPPANAADRVLAAEFLPEGVVFDDALDIVIVWNSSAQVELQVNSGKITSFVDLPGCRVRARFFSLLAMDTPCVIDHFRLRSADGRMFTIRGLRWTKKATNDGVVS